MNMTSRWWSYTEKDRQKILSMKGGWIVQNLLTYGNCLLPNKDVDEYGIKYIERRLSKTIGEKVKIDTRQVDELGTCYIAEVKENK